MLRNDLSWLWLELREDLSAFLRDVRADLREIRNARAARRDYMKGI
jgi:hypothetical protein